MVQKSCAASDVDQQFYVVQAGTAYSGYYVIKPVSSSKADAGLGAGNACLTTSVKEGVAPYYALRYPAPGRLPDYARWVLSLERAADCSTSRECPEGGWSPYDGAEGWQGGDVLVCEFGADYAIPATDELLISDIQVPPGTVGFPVHKYELRLNPDPDFGSYEFPAFCWAPDPLGTVVSETGGRASLGSRSAVVQADGVRVIAHPCSRGTLTIGDLGTRWRFEAVQWTRSSR